ncbi:MAG TPA: hypothetical protein VNG90_04605 [Candidatus Acidoferrum sp.]|nr:hypothetical protein [Candidatus Acidoferrum sp.]
MHIVDQDQVERDLLAGVITTQEAFQLITSKQPKPWETKEWKEARERLLSAQCVQCGSTQPPLVLQHLWQPTALRTLISITREGYMEAYAVGHPRPVVPEPALTDRPGCPRCKSTNIRQAKGDGRWTCCKRGCGRIFQAPVTVQALTPEQKRQLSEQNATLGKIWFQEFWSIYSDTVVKEAVLQSIAHHRRYMSLEDTTTFCKTCMYWWDMRKRRYCPDCQKYSVLLIGTLCLHCGNNVPRLARIGEDVQ